MRNKFNPYCAKQKLQQTTFLFFSFKENKAWFFMWFTWNIMSYFLWKTIKKYLWMLSAATQLWLALYGLRSSVIWKYPVCNFFSLFGFMACGQKLELPKLQSNLLQAENGLHLYAGWDSSPMVRDIMFKSQLSKPLWPQRLGWMFKTAHLNFMKNYFKTELEGVLRIIQR